MRLAIPQKSGGTLPLPAVSVPKAKGTHLAATRPASPPDEPPQVLVLSYGFKHAPQSLLSEWNEKANYKNIISIFEIK